MESKLPADPGLCGNCAHARLVESSRGSLFLLCAAHKINPNLPKYPRLPVTACPEHTPEAAENEAEDTP